MINIIKHGYQPPITIKFECNKCGCEWETDEFRNCGSSVYGTKEDYYTKYKYEHNCPNCGESSTRYLG